MKTLLRIFAHLILKGFTKFIFGLRQGISNKNKLVIAKGSLLFYAKLLVKGKENRVEFGRHGIYRHVDIEISGRNNLVRFGDKTKVYEGLRILIVGDNCRLEVGEKTTIGLAKIQLGESATEVQIGFDCMLSRDVSINTSDFHSVIEMETGKRINLPQSVKIEDHTWIGNGVYINKGARIGADSVIAARSVCVGKTYASNSILAGVPAKEVKHGINWSREKLT